MDSRSYDSRQELKKAFWGFASLLGSSVISAIGFMVIAANRWVSIDPACGVFIILFVQWQTLGLTITKTGIEQVVFAMVSDQENTYLDPARYIYRKALPLAALFSLVVLFVFSPWAAIVALATILLDTYSLIVMADLNARKMFRVTALSNLLNYPLFFIAIFAINHLGRLTTAVALGVFLLSSLVRWLWLKGNRFFRPGMREVACRVNGEMGLQQALNYLLFRVDQLVLAVMGLNVQVQESIGTYVFLAKFPELVAGVMGVAATVVFPRLYIRYPFDLAAFRSQARQFVILASGYTVGIALSGYCYVSFWQGQRIPFYLLLPFLIHALCIILVNNITYSTLRQGYLRRLLLNLAFAVLTGLTMVVFLQFEFSARTLSWIVPVQLVAFITLSFLFKWGRTRELYG